MQVDSLTVERAIMHEQCETTRYTVNLQVTCHSISSSDESDSCIDDVTNKVLSAKRLAIHCNTLAIRHIILLQYIGHETHA